MTPSCPDCHGTAATAPNGIQYCNHDDNRASDRPREACGTFDADTITHLLALVIQFDIGARTPDMAADRRVNARAAVVLNRMAGEVSRG